MVVRVMKMFTRMEEGVNSTGPDFGKRIAMK